MSEIPEKAFKRGVPKNRAYKKNKTIVVHALPFLITINPYRDHFLFTMKKMLGRNPNEPDKINWVELTLSMSKGMLKDLGALIIQSCL